MASKGSGSRESGGPGNSLVGDFKLGHEIGRGSFAVVFKGHHQTKRQLAAIKVVQRAKMSKKLLENLESEIAILKKLHHPHIVALHDCKKTDKHIFLIMEYCSVGDLSVVIKKRDRLASVHPCMEDVVKYYPSPPGGGLHEVLVRHFLKQLTSALEFLRKDGLVHRDVKPQNLLLNPPLEYEMRFGDNGNMEGSQMIVGLPTLPVLKLADFGFARVLPASSMAETLCGSPLYMAPEILRYEKYDATADLWSVGTVAYEAITGKAPFRAPNHVDLLRKIESKQDRIEFPSSVEVSDDLRHLIKSLLKRSPVDRMSFEELFQHPVIVNPIPNAGLTKQFSRTAPRQIDVDAAAAVPQQPAARSVPADSAIAMARTPSVSKRAEPRIQAMEREARSARDKDSALSSSPRRTLTAPVENSQLPFATPLETQGGTPPRLSDIRRFTTGATGSSPPVRDRHSPSQRPGMPHATTAPAREEVVRRGTPMERVRSRDTTSSPSALAQQREEQRQYDKRVQRTRTQASRELRASADEDYVIVDKQQVQVNAFADELASARRGRVSPASNPHTSLVRRLSRGSNNNSPLSSTAAARRPDSGHRPSSSYERRYGSSPSSHGKSTLAKALELANLRLFGVSVSPPNPSPPEPRMEYPGSGSLIRINASAPQITDEDRAAIEKIEASASRSEVVYVFAQVKYAQIEPSASSPPNAHVGLVSSESPENNASLELTPDATVHTAEECLVLFVKTLSLLTHATVRAHAWWSTLDPRTPLSPARTAACTRMNTVVQWMRERFNEVLEKAEIVQRRIVQAQQALPASHPWHPSQHQGGGEEGGFVFTTGVTAEKLMYDRALEMSRASAVNELVGEDLPGCEGAYATAMRLLEAVVEGAEGEGMEEGDRGMIEKLLEHIRQRMVVIRRKMERSAVTLTAVPSA